MKSNINSFSIPNRCATIVMALIVTFLLAGAQVYGQQDGTILRNSQPVFPIGSYELPDDDEALKAMANAGINIIRCGNRKDLDRVHALGVAGWIPLLLQGGATDALRAKIESVVDHPALAVWEGPDEVVWGFTAGSGLWRNQGIHKNKHAWWHQTPEAIAYAEKKASTIIPNMHAAAKLVRSIDTSGRPLWMNEALKSDPIYVRQYLDSFDIIGCDIYPIRADRRPVAAISVATEHWKRLGRGKPVWMVLQAFSWSDLGGYHGDTGEAYPTFAESRFMSYDVIARGGKGIMYWGTGYLKSEACLESIFALTSELSMLQPFLTAADMPNTHVSLVELPEESVVPLDAPEERDDPWYPGSVARLPEGNLQAVVRNIGDDWLIIVVNEDNEMRMGVVVGGLDTLNGQTFDELYNTRTATISHGELMLRMRPYEVRVFATGRHWESPRRVGRDFSE